jgi:Clr5 domain
MAPPSIDLNPYKDEIIHLLFSGTTISDVTVHLQRTYKLQVNPRTLRRRLKTWNVVVRPQTQDTPALRSRITELFFNGLDETQLLRALQQEDYQIGKYSLVRIREELGLKRYLRTTKEQDIAEARTLEILTEELQKGVIEGYGRGLLYAHFQQLGAHIARFVRYLSIKFLTDFSSDRLFSIYRTLVPNAIERRTHNMQRHRGEYIIPGPNFVWSVDRYLKLAPYDIEVYAAINAYSRYIIWIYVGTSARTAVSVLRQYLDTVEMLGQHSRFIRSDHGTETVLLASAHYQLQRMIDSDIEFPACYLYGSSTTNQRIEAWWNQLTKGLLFRWRVCYHTTLTCIC